MSDINARIDKLEAAIGNRFDELTVRIDNRFDELATRIGKRFDELAARIDNRFDELEAGLRFQFTWMVWMQGIVVTLVVGLLLMMIQLLFQGSCNQIARFFFHRIAIRNPFPS